MAERWVTFDCYGTLIDWELGIGTALSDLWPEAELERLLQRYYEIEPEIQDDYTGPYRDVMRMALERIAEEEGLAIQSGREDVLAESLPTWPPFPEVPAALGEIRGRGWKIGILSNTDPDLLDASIALLGVDVDVRITAAEAGSYKPKHGHWKKFFDVTGVDKDQHVHVAASVFHDISPAEEMALKTVWINRAGEITNLPRDAELEDLTELPQVLDQIIPPPDAER
jgi:2-haloacid dehalogenase